jgi:hypothetical protein
VSQGLICGATLDNQGTRCAKQRYFSAFTGIGVCPHCDTAGSCRWPDDYNPWRKGMPYPGEETV